MIIKFRMSRPRMAMIAIASCNAKNYVRTSNDPCPKWTNTNEDKKSRRKRHMGSSKNVGNFHHFHCEKTAVRPIHFSRNPSEAIEASAKAPVGRVCFASPAVEGTPAEWSSESSVQKWGTPCYPKKSASDSSYALPKLPAENMMVKTSGIWIIRMNVW